MNSKVQGIYTVSFGTERSSDDLERFATFTGNSLFLYLTNLFFALYLICIVLRPSIILVEGEFTVGEGGAWWWLPYLRSPHTVLDNNTRLSFRLQRQKKQREWLALHRRQSWCMRKVRL